MSEKLEKDYSKPIFGEPVFVRKQNQYKSWTTDKETGKRTPMGFLPNVPKGDYKSLEEALQAMEHNKYLGNLTSIPINIQEDNGYVSTYQVPISYGFKNPYGEAAPLKAPLTGFEVSKIGAPQLQIKQPVIKQPVEQYATYVYFPDGRLFARRTWEQGKPGKAYTTADGMDLNDFLKGNPDMLQYPYTDQEFFDKMYDYTADDRTWRIASGDYRKPGNVYLEYVDHPTQSSTSNQNMSNGYSNIYTTTPEQINETIHNMLKNVSTFKNNTSKKAVGGILNYLKYFQ